MTLSLYNTRTRKKEEFKPLVDKKVGLYTCGPTVYNYAHIGNLRTYVFEDILRRVLKYNGFEVNHVMNITDVGHLTDDADQGEDKMEKGSKREGKTAWEIAEFYTQAFKDDMQALNLLEPHTWCKATDHIEEQIAQVQTLIDRGFTYETSDGIYFDTTKLDDYGKLANLQNQELKAGERVDMGEKKNPHDFALWKRSVPKGASPEQSEGSVRQMEWEAFGFKGFPGWHIECSAMSMKYLGDQFDIHCGGIDHIPVHHTNEVAQAESSSGVKPWVNFWLHGEFLVIDEARMGKSKGNFITMNTLKEKKVSPLSYRYFLLQTHYRKQLNFSWEALEAAASGLKNLRNLVANIPDHAARDPYVREQFVTAINDDLNMPEALATLWKGLKNHQLDLEMVIEFDKVLGLKLHDPNRKNVEIPEEVQKLLDARQLARDEKNWEESDRLREEISGLGFVVKDRDDGQEVSSV